MKKLNVLFILPSLDVGGSELKVLSLIKLLDKTKFNPQLLLITKKGLLYEKAAALGCDIFVVNKTSKFDVFVIRRIRKIIKKQNIDIIHTFTSTAKLWGRLAAKKHRQVIISTEESLFRNTFIDRLLEKLLVRRTDLIIANSDSTLESALSATKINENKYLKIYNGIETSKYQNSNKVFSNELKILTVARLDVRKGLIYLIEALSLLKQANINFQLTIAGEGEEKPELQRLINQLDLTSQVKFLGFVSDIPKLMSKHNLFILPSLEEGFGNVIVEAMLAKLFVIASNAGGIPEIINSKDIGIIVNKKSSTDIFDAIKWFNDNKTAASKVVDNAYVRALEFSASKMTKKHEDIYIELYERKFSK